MTWVRLDDQFPDHPKLQRVSDAAGWLFVCGLCYCARQRTNGEIPAAKVRTLTRSPKPARLAGELVEVVLWEEIPDGFLVHDYLVYQPSAEQLSDRRAKESDRKRSYRVSRRDKPQDNIRDGDVTATGPLTGAGLGVGTEVGPTTERPAELDAITEATAILESVWETVDPVGVENAAATDPTADLVAAARLAATWGSDEGWTMGAAASLRAAMRKLHAESGAGRSKAERESAGIAAISRLIGEAA